MRSPKAVAMVAARTRNPPAPAPVLLHRSLSTNAARGVTCVVPEMDNLRVHQQRVDQDKQAQTTGVKETVRAIWAAAPSLPPPLEMTDLQRNLLAHKGTPKGTLSAPNPRSLYILWRRIVTFWPRSPPASATRHTTAWSAGMSFVLHTRSGTARSVGQLSIWTVSPPGQQSLQKIPTTTEQDGDVQGARTHRSRFHRNTAASAARSTTLISTAILPLTLVANSVAAQETVLILAITHAILVPALHAAVLVLSSPAIVETNRSSSAVLIPTFRSRQENLATKCAASFWDVASTPAPLFATLDYVHPVRNLRSKSAIAGSMGGRRVAAMEM